MSLRVDNIPLVFRPVYLAISFIIAIALYCLCVAINLSCRIKFEGERYLEKNKNYIFCMWHQTLAAYFAVFINHRGNHIWMNHPSWVMKPIHYWLWLSGVRELALGSVGNSGQEALQKVILFLKNGYNSLITPDGPAGPPHTLKPGVIQMAIETGIPVVPVKIIPSHFFILPSWDKKRIPLPFSTLFVIYEKPIIVTQNEKEKAMETLELALIES